MTDRNPKATLAELAAQALREEPSALERPSFDHRTNQIGAIEHALRGRARRRRIVRHALAVALVAAPAAAALIVRISVPSFTRNSAAPPAASTVPLSSPVLERS